MFAGENMTVSFWETASSTVSVTDDEAAPMTASTPSVVRRSTDCDAMSVVVSPESVCETVTSLAKDATSFVDLLDCEVDAGELGWPEERQAAGLRQQGSELQRAVAGRGSFGRRFGSTRAFASLVVAAARGKRKGGHANYGDRTPERGGADHVLSFF